jgi:hypothetical protein
MQLTLVAPGLLDLPGNVLAAIDAQAPALSRLLASAAAPETEDDGLLGAACRACGMARQDDWPVAPRLARACGIDPQGAYWLCAEPVTLVVGADDVRLSGVVDDLSLEDAQALVARLNAHFERDGIEFVVADAARWFVRTHDVQRLSTRPSEAALGAPLFEFLPRGDDAARWRRWLNESQMILFEHAVNQRRQAENRAPANSIWLWGGGTDQPPAGPSRGTRIFGGDSRTCELTRGSGIEVAPLPASFDALAALVGSTPAVVWLDPLVPESALRGLSLIDRAWMAPALRALDAGSVSVEIVVGGQPRAQRFQPRRATLTQRVRARFSPPRGSALLLSEARESAMT